MRNWLIGLSILFIGQAFAQAPAFPFPQHTTYTAGSIKPNVVTQSGMDKVVKQFYNKWKTRYLHSGCEPGHYYVYYNFEGGADPANAICVSEGQGYGMMITAYMAGYDPNAKNYFDGLYYYYKSHPSIINPTLMAWQQITGCENVDGADAATDGDLDIAYALLLAHAQWGSDGVIDYLNEAIALIDAIYTSEINNNNQTIKLGDWVSGSVSPMSYSTRSSDFMPDHFKSFFAATGDNHWQQTSDRCYTITDAIQTNYSTTTGLMPDFIRHTNTVPDPAAPNFLESTNDGDYYYNACRFPWRIATDYLITGDTMIDGSNQAWLNSLWNYMKTVNINRDGYYGNSIKLLSLIVISSNWWAPDDALFRASEPSTNSDITIYPNPVSETLLHINLPTNELAGGQYAVLGLDGRKTAVNGMFEGASTTIDIADLPPGTYLIVINTISGVYSKTFVKL